MSEIQFPSRILHRVVRYGINIGYRSNLPYRFYQPHPTSTRAAAYRVLFLLSFLRLSKYREGEAVSFLRARFLGFRNDTFRLAFTSTKISADVAATPDLAIFRRSGEKGTRFLRIVSCKKEKSFVPRWSAEDEPVLSKSSFFARRDDDSPIIARLYQPSTLDGSIDVLPVDTYLRLSTVSEVNGRTFLRISRASRGRSSARLRG